MARCGIGNVVLYLGYDCFIQNHNFSGVLILHQFHFLNPTVLIMAFNSKETIQHCGILLQGCQATLPILRIYG